MTKFIRKKCLAVILTLAMVISLLPTLTLPASAADTTYTVTNLNDSGSGSLRQAIQDAAATSGGSTITFDSSLSGKITLASNLPELGSSTGNFTLEGLTDADGKPNITIDGNKKWSGISALGSGTFSISNIVFTGFSLTSTDGLGAVISTGVGPGYAGYTTINLSNCVFSGNMNSTPSIGAVVQLAACASPNTITVDRCIFKDNTLINTDPAKFPSSAALAVSGHASITNSLFCGNTHTASYSEKADGCAILVREDGDYNVNVLSNTFYGNSITNNGAGGAEGAVVSHESPASGTLSVYNNIMLDNTATGNSSEDRDIYAYVATISKEKNVSTGSASDIFTDLDNGDFTLKSTATTMSTIIDKGDNTYLSGSYDLAGKTRSSGTAIDIGAYESSPVTITPASALTEENLATNSLTVTLLNTTFKNSTLDKENFTLNNAPDGVTIASVTKDSDTQCTITLAYDGTDFDTNVTNLSLTVKAAELDSGSDLTSGTLTITATVETAPTVTTDTVSTYAATTATMGGNVTASGGESVTEKGVVYSSTDSTPAIGESGVTKDTNGTGTGAFSESVSGLSPNTTYYVCAYATNSVGTSYGSVVSFTTTAISASITPASALTEENLDTNSLTVTLLGTTFKDNTLDISNFSLNNVTSIGLTIESVTYTDTTHCTVNLTYSGTDFDAAVTNLSLTVKAAELDSGSDLTSGTLTITATDETVPTVTTDTVSTFAATTATMGGNVTASGGESVTERGVVYSSTDSTPEIGESGATKDTNGTGTGTFSESISGLSPNMTYYICAYATNSVGTSYGSVVSFTTPETYTVSTLTNQTMTALTEGYSSGAQETKIITVTRTGTGTLTGLTVALSGAGSSSFIITQPAVTTLNSTTASTTFTVKAKDGLAAGSYTATVSVSATNMTDATFSVTQVVNSTYSSGGSSGSSSGNNGAAVIVNGETKTAGTAQTTTNSSGQTTTTVTVDTSKLENILASQGTGATVTIPITGNSDVAAGTLTGAMVKSMETKDATLVVQTHFGTYTLPASEININAVSQQLGTSVALSDIKVTVSISEPSASMTKVIESAAQNGGFTIMVPAVDYTITCTHGNQTVNVGSFNAYVERTIAIPDGVDPTKITTGVVVDPDGTTHHVPTRVTVMNGKYYAVINSLTNSTYSVVWNPIEFSDVSNHWAKTAINDMGSRMVVNGVGNNNYAPDRNMTRAEFAAIMTRALGLEPETGASGFGDVAVTDWYSGYIKTAAAYGIIKGYDNGNFGPNDTITREQAMTMIARAMAITKLSAGLTDGKTSQLLSTFSDGESASTYAKESIAACLKTGITSGTSETTLSPQANITRAEVAVMVERLLQKSNLI